MIIVQIVTTQNNTSYCREYISEVVVHKKADKERTYVNLPAVRYGEVELSPAEAGGSPE